MKKTGFTLVELLAVIVILAIVLIIAVPGVLSIINKTKENAYERQIDMIKEATRLYVTTNPNVDWRDHKTVVNLSDLQGQGLLDQKLIDPRSKKEIKGIAVVVTKTGNNMNYDIVYTGTSNANYPVYNQAMIPIRYDGTNWVKADASNKDFTWFNYDNQQWANIATVTEDVRQTLLDAPVGTEVPIEKINTMFVWIPRFKYKLFNVDGTVSPVGNANMAGDYMIDIKFEGSSVSKATGTQNGEWLTHPAFTFGGQELDGFWMAKFETGYLGATTTTGAHSNTLDPFKVIVKPNTYSWRSIQAVNMYKNAQGMKDAANPYGLTANEDPHMMKNMEWGAMAYLTQSKYGKQGNPNYTGLEKEVRMNNNNAFLTGCGADSPTPTLTNICNTYETTNGQAASTTGNITGIYDTSGGAWDYTASGIFDEKKENLVISLSGFDQAELNQIGRNGKYLDVYDYSAIDYMDQSRGHLGDATIEMGPFNSDKGAWYEDYAGFVTKENPYFLRGTGAYPTYPTQNAGTMSYHHSNGNVSTVDGYRIVII